MQLGADSAAAQAKVSQRQLRQQQARRLEEILDRDPLSLVVVLALEIADGRTERDVAVNGLAQVNAKSVGVRQRVHERVDQMTFDGHQFRVFAAARIDSKPLPADSGGDVVRVKSRRVDD